jgi:glycosyltransferase involved in cell wall biosynthesis
MNSVKLLFFVPHLYHGGVFVVFSRLLKGLSVLGYSIHVVVGDAEAQLLSQLSQIQNIKIVYLDAPRARNVIWALRKLLNNEDYNILIGVQSHGVWAVVLSALLSKYKGKIVSWEHGYPSLLENKSIMDKVKVVFAKILYSRVDKAFAVSKGVARDVASFYNIKSEKVQEVPNPVYETLPNVSRKNKKDGDVINFLFVGRLAPGKGVNDILRALNVLACSNWTLTIVGDGPDLPMLQDFVSKEGNITEKVSFVGRQTNPSEWYERSDALILASYNEGMPTVLVEATIYGLPLISTDCESGPNEIISHGKNGLLVPVGDYKSLSLAIERFVTDYSTFSNEASIVKRYKDDIAVKYFSDSLNAIL